MKRRGILESLGGIGAMGAAGCSSIDGGSEPAVSSKKTDYTTRTEEKEGQHEETGRYNVSDLDIRNATGSPIHVDLFVNPKSTKLEEFREHFTLQADTTGGEIPKRKFSEVEQMRSECNVRIRADDDRQDSYNWKGGPPSYSLRIIIYESEIVFSELEV